MVRADLQVLVDAVDAPDHRRSGAAGAYPDWEAELLQIVRGAVQARLSRPYRIEKRSSFVYCPSPRLGRRYQRDPSTLIGEPRGLLQGPSWDPTHGGR